MNIILNILILFLGFIILIKGADYFVDGSSKIAEYLGIPHLIIGLTIVAFGTSAPECAVSVIASIKNNSSLSISNVIGSNICNLLLVLGATGLFGKLECNKKVLIRDFSFMFLSYFFIFFICIKNFLSYKNIYFISKLDGLCLLLLFVIYILFLLFDKKDSLSKYNYKINIIDIILTLLGLIFIISGGEIVVNNASSLALSLGISNRVIGLSIVAIGTSLPELVTSIIAIIKDKKDIAIGNIIGSNIFNIFMIIGVSSLFNPLYYNLMSILDIVIMIFSGLIVYLMFIIKKRIDLIHSIFLVSLYIIYIIYLIVK